MSRRWKIALGVVAGLVIVIAVGIVLTLRLSSPPVAEFRVSTERKDLPEAWLAPEEGPSAEPPKALDEPPATTAQSDSRKLRESFSTTGTLSFVSDGRPFGEESYELRIENEETTLTSLGRFWFKALVATINITFEQRLTGDAALNPRTYNLSLDAPLGFDREVRVEIADGRAVATSGETRTETSVAQPYVVGTFATYALLPIVFPSRQIDGSAAFDLLAFGGPPSQSSGGGPARMLVERRSPVTIRAGDSILAAEALVIRSGFGDGTLLAKDEEFLAFLATGEDGSLIVYRTDFFPEGFEILDDVGLPAMVP